MNNQATIDKMHQMKLFGMTRSFKSSVETGIDKNFTVDEFVAQLVDTEWDDRYKALGGQSGGQSHSVLLTDTDVDDSIRELSGCLSQPCAVQHSGADNHHPFVFTHQASRIMPAL